MKLITSMTRTVAWTSRARRRDLALAVVSVCDNNVRMFKKIVYRG